MLRRLPHRRPLLGMSRLWTTRLQPDPARRWWCAPTPHRQTGAQQSVPVKRSSRRVRTRPDAEHSRAWWRRPRATHDVDPLLVHSMIQVESNYNPHAVSPKGAEGLMQLMPSTARDAGREQQFRSAPEYRSRRKYLKYLQDLYKDDRLALAAYNAGPGAVEKYKWIPPYPETQNYVNQVGKRYGAAKKAAAQHLAEPAVPPVGVMEETRPKLEPFVDAEGRLHLRNTPQ